MLGRLGWLGAAVLAVSCGGESRLGEHRLVRAAGAHAGGNANRGGSAGCAACDAGRAAGGRSGAGGGFESAGASPVSGASGEGTSEAGAPEGDAGGQGGVTDHAGSSGIGRAGRAGANASAGTDEGGAAGAPASAGDGLRILKVAVYQAVEVTLVKNGADVAPNAPVVADREALVRVWLEPESAWTPRAVEAELAVGNGTN